MSESAEIISVPFAPYYDADGITIYNADCRKVLPFLSADVVQWNAFSQLTSYAEQLHVELMNQIRDKQGVRNA